MDGQKEKKSSKEIYWHYCIYFDISRAAVAVTRKFSSIAGAVKKSRKNGSNGSITKIWKRDFDQQQQQIINAQFS